MERFFSLFLIRISPSFCFSRQFLAEMFERERKANGGCFSSCTPLSRLFTNSRARRGDGGNTISLFLTLVHTHNYSFISFFISLRSLVVHRDTSATRDTPAPLLIFSLIAFPTHCFSLHHSESEPRQSNHVLCCKCLRYSPIFDLSLHLDCPIHGLSPVLSV